MRRTFNLGLGMVLAVAAAELPTVQAAIPDALVVGRVVRRTGSAAAVQWEETE